MDGSEPALRFERASLAYGRSTVVTDWSVGVPDSAGVVEVPDCRPLRPWMRNAR